MNSSWRDRVAYRTVVVRRLIAGAALAALMAGPVSSARADEPRVSRARLDASDVGNLAREVTSLERAFRKLGRVERLRPRLLERNETVPLVLDARVTREQEGRCTTIVAIGTRNVSFQLQFAPSAEAMRERAFPIPSAAGVAEVTRCGEKRPLLESLGVHLRSPRAVVEVLVLVSRTTPPHVAEILPSRDAGSSLAAPQIGPRPRGASLTVRTQRVREDNAAAGARAQRLTGVTTDRTGQGQTTLHFAVGCHRLDVLAAAAEEGSADLDARLTNVQDGTEIVRDESESSTARLRFCVGRADRFLLAVQGAPAGSETTVVHAEWDLPRGLPVDWGPVARAELARVLWREHPPLLPDMPVWAGLGVQGTTDVWFPARPGGCYTIAAARMRGELTRVVLEADAGPRTGQSYSSPDRDGAMLSLCSEGSDRIHVRVHALGPGLAWLLAAWEVQSGERP